jgi:hypothetical protein
MDIFAIASRVETIYGLAAFVIAGLVTVVTVWIKRGRYATEQKAMSRAKGDELVELAYAFGNKYALPTNTLNGPQVVRLVQEYVAGQERRSFRLACIAAVVTLISLIAILFFMFFARPTSSVSDALDAWHRQLLSIVSGSKESKCAADSSGSNVQFFEHGRMLINRSKHKIYAILPTSDDTKILWMGRTDVSNQRRAACDGVENEELLQFGFRWLYCNTPDLKARLGKPLTGEIGACRGAL